MMPGLSIDHLVILGIIALVVVGPKDLPLLLRKLGQWTARLRAMAQEFRSGFDELARQAELDELRREVDALRHSTNVNSIAKNIAGDVAKPLGTLESYAGATPAAPQPAPVSDAVADAGASSPALETPAAEQPRAASAP